jgi:enoyl-CoA hydratase
LSLTVEDCGGGVRALTLRNDARRNALDEETLGRLEQALTNENNVRCWLVRGHGGHFCSGYDLTALGGLDPRGPLPDERIGQVFDLLAEHSAPSVAWVSGAAYGAGLELSCACDFRVADPSCAFSIPPARLGIVYAPKGIRRVARVVGLGKARVLFLSARRVKGAEALTFGLADELGSHERALALCQELAGHAPLALAGMKRIFRSLEGTVERDADLEALRLRSFTSDDAREGVTALLEKRAPKFTGR